MPTGASVSKPLCETKYRIKNVTLGSYFDQKNEVIIVKALIMMGTCSDTTYLGSQGELMPELQYNCDQMHSVITMTAPGGMKHVSVKYPSHCAATITEI